MHLHFISASCVHWNIRGKNEGAVEYNLFIRIEQLFTRKYLREKKIITYHSLPMELPLLPLMGKCHNLCFLTFTSNSANLSQTSKSISNFSIDSWEISDVYEAYHANVC